MSQGTPVFVVAGAGLTAGAAVSTLRAEGFDGQLVVIGAEPHPPYERPPLSKEYLRGEVPRESTVFRPMKWYEDQGVDLRLGTLVARVELGERAVVLDGGERVAFDGLLVATGARNRPLLVPGHDLEGIHQLRTIEDSDAIRGEAVPGRSAVIVGAGFIGCEVAASLRARGVEVSVVEPLAGAMLRVVGPEVSGVLEGIHRDHGVRFRFGEVVSRFEGSRRVERVVTDRGAVLDCDFAVVGVGIQPNVEPVEETDVAVENGVLVDEYCRTNVPGVFAAGDVANHYHPLFGRRMRVEHYDNALSQGAAAARNMLGPQTVFDDPHWFWSDQYEHNLQYVGLAAQWDELVVRGSLDERRFVAFYVSGGIVIAAVGLDRGRDVRRAAGIIRSRRPVDHAALRDEDVDLRRLAQSPDGRGRRPG